MDHLLTPVERDLLETARASLSCSFCHELQTDPHYLAACSHSFCENCLNQALGSKSACPDCVQLTGRKDITKFHALGTLVASFDRFQKFLGQVTPPISPPVQPANESQVQRPISEPLEGEQAQTPRHVLAECTCREEDGTLSPHLHPYLHTTTTVARAHTVQVSAGVGGKQLRQAVPAFAARSRGVPMDSGAAMDRRVVPDSMAADGEEWQDHEENGAQTETQMETEPEGETDSMRVFARPGERVRVADTYDDTDFYGAEEADEEEEETETEKGKKKGEEAEAEDIDEGTLRETSSSELVGAGNYIDDGMSGSERDAAATMARFVTEIEEGLDQAKAASVARKRRRQD